MVFFCVEVFFCLFLCFFIVDKAIQLPVGRLDNVEWKRLKTNMDGAGSSYVWDVLGVDLHQVMCGNHYAYTCVTRTESGSDDDDDDDYFQP